MKTLFLTPAATAAGGFFVPAVRGAGRRDAVTPLDMQGIRIANHVVGGVLVQAADYDYFTFDAWKSNAAGQPIGAGTAVICLTDCVKWRFRVGGDQHLIDYPVDPAKLPAGGTYEVMNSSWVRDLVADDPSLRRANLHHCIFTFQETNFECVLSRYDHKIHTGSFNDLYNELVSDGV